MSYSEIKIHGLKELDNNLKQLPFKIQKKVLGGTVRAGANIVKKEAKSKVPIKTGWLKKNIIARKKRKSSVYAPIYQIGPSNKAWYGRIIEFGSSKMSATPWLRPAFDISGKKVIAKIREILANGIEREAKKLGA